MLNVEIVSFSYKKGLPQTNPEHGGGFVFDCRCLPNPGREDRYKLLSGKDAEVKTYLAKSPEVSAFGAHVLALLEQAIANYLERKFERLSVSFGCTGGQHRSVFFAELIAHSLVSRSDLKATLSHRDLEQALREAKAK